MIDKRALLRPIAWGVLAQACAVGLLAVSGWLLSRAAEHPPVLYLMTTIVAVRALGIGRGVLRYQERLAGHDGALAMQSRLRVRAFGRLASGVQTRRGSDLLSRLVSDIDAVQDLVVRVIVPVVSAGLVLAAAGAVIAAISWPAGLVLLADSLLAGVLLPMITARLSADAARRRAPQRAELAEEVGVIARSRFDLSAYALADAAVARVARADRRLADAERRSAYLAGLAGGLQWLVTGAVIIASSVIGGRALAAGDLDPVLLAVLVLTPLALHEVAAALPGAAQTALHCRTALRRVRELVGRPAADEGDPDDGESLPGDPDADPRIRTDRLSIGRPGGPVLASGIGLDVGPGERVAVVGPSGVGKSTLAATLMGFLPPRGGRVEIGRRIGYLAQDAHIFDTTVSENVRIGRRDASDRDVRTALAEVGLDDLASDRPVGEFGGRLSGGEARRLALARLLVADCTTLIVDEPTEHLDAVTGSEIIDLLLTVRPRAAMLIITHDPELIARCDRTVALQPAYGPTVNTVTAGPQRESSGDDECRSDLVSIP